MNKHQKCPQFGWGCDVDDKFCLACKAKDECFKITWEDKAKKDRGLKPNIPKAQKPIKHVAGLSKPRIDNLPFRIHSGLPLNNNKKLSFMVWIDLEWLKKQLGLSYFKDKGD